MGAFDATGEVRKDLHYEHKVRIWKLKEPSDERLQNKFSLSGATLARWW